MITDKTLDEALVELMRCKKALEALRAKRKTYDGVKVCADFSCSRACKADDLKCPACGSSAFYSTTRDDVREHAAAKRASLDLTRKLADLRAGR